MNRANRSPGSGLLGFLETDLQHAEAGRSMAGSLPARLRGAMNRATGSQRGLAVAALLLVPPCFMGGAESTWAGIWIALLLGGGAAAMALPATFGWSRDGVGRLGALMLVLGLLTVIVLTSTLSVDFALVRTFRQSVLIASALAAVVSVSMVFHIRRLGHTLETVALPFSAALTISSGAALVVLGITGWPALHALDPALAISMAITSGLWMTAFLCNQLEATRGFRWAGRLAGLRSGAIRLAAIPAGLAVARFAVPRLQDAAWHAAIATPLEGLAPLAGAIAGACAGLAVCGLGLALPGLLARRQLGARISAATAGETAWFSAWMLLPAAGFWLFEVFAVHPRTLMWVDILGPTPFVRPPDFTPVDDAAARTVMACLAVLVHGAVRLLLSRPVSATGTPLWLVLPGEAPVSATLWMAERMASEWQYGPVNLLAPQALARRVRGAHLRLATSAGSAAQLFPRAAFGAGFLHGHLSGKGMSEALRVREIYATVAAARALMAGLPDDARVLVLADTRLPEGWAAALGELPEHSERFIRARTTLGERVDESWKEVDFGQSDVRERLIVDFFVKHRPRAADERRMLILHGASDEVLAMQLAHALDGRVDPQGRHIVASVLQPATSGTTALGWSEGSWLTLLALFNRFTELDELGTLSRFVGRFLAPSRTDAQTRRFDLIVIESGMARTEARSARGLERMVDSVIGLTPAMRRHDIPTLYAREAYTVQLTLPAPSALQENMPQLVHQLINIAPAEATI